MNDFVQSVVSLRIDLAPVGCSDHFVLVVPVPGSEYPGFREFYIMDRDLATGRYLFGLMVSSDDEAVRLALSTGPEYIW